MLSDFLANILRKVRKNTVYMCGDFNVDLLQFDKHGATITNEFIDQIYTLGLVIPWVTGTSIDNKTNQNHKPFKNVDR